MSNRPRRCAPGGAWYFRHSVLGILTALLFLPALAAVSAAEGGRVSAGSSHASAADGTGGAFVVWSDRRNGVDTDVHIQRVAAPTVGHPEVAQWTPNGVPVCTAAGNQDTAVVVSDGAGGAIVAWEDARGGERKVYAQRFDPSGVPQWTLNGVALCTSVGSQLRPTIVPDGAGGAFVAWIDIRRVFETDIYAQHVGPSGTRLWADSAFAVCAASESQVGVVGVPADSGGVIFGWLDSRSGASGLYAARIAADGVARWAVDGVLVNADATPFAQAVMAADGAGGVLVAWLRSLPTARTWAQRLSSDGALLWPAGGVDAAPALSLFGPFAPAVVSDGAGGAIIASDGFAQRVDATGAVLWGVDGVQVLNSPLGVASSAAVPDGTGGAIVAWGQLLQRINASGVPQWTSPYVVVSKWARDPGNSMVSDGAGGAILAWKDYRDEYGGVDVYAQHFVSGGTAQWTDGGVALYLAAGLRKQPVCAADGLGNVIAVWAQKRGGYYRITARKLESNGGTIWPSVTLGSGGGSQTSPLATPDGAGGAVVAWTDWRDGLPALYVQRVNAGGGVEWDLGGVLLRVGDVGPIPTAIVPDGTGGAIVAWQEGVWTNPLRVHVGRVDGAGNLPWGNTGVDVCTLAGDRRGAVLASDGAGGAIVAWLDERDAFFTQTFAQRVDASGTLQWDAGGVAMCTTPIGVGTLALTPDGSGGAIAAFSDQNGADSEIRIQRVDPSGTVAWTGGGETLVASSYGSFRPAIVADGLGGAVVGWYDTRPDLGNVINHGVYAQRVGPSGSARWTAGGVKLRGGTTVVLEEAGPTLVGDGAGGVIATWCELRNVFIDPQNTDLYAQRADSAGVVLWDPEGAPICVSSGRQSLPATAADGAGGAFCFWQDSRDPTRDDVFGLLLTSAGGAASGWGVDGVTATLASLLTSEAAPGHVRLVWSLAVGGMPAKVYRSFHGVWNALGRLLPDGTGRAVFEDRDVEPGDHVGYRLGFAVDGGETFSGEVWLDVPCFVFALEGAHPNPAASSAFNVRFSLPSTEPATLEVLDVAGRRLASYDVGLLGVGTHDLKVAGARRWGAGLYLVRLRQSNRALVTKVALVR